MKLFQLLMLHETDFQLLEATDGHGRNPLFLALTVNALRTFERLLIAKANPDSCGPDGRKIIVHAIEKGHGKFTELLLRVCISTFLKHMRIPVVCWQGDQGSTYPPENEFVGILNHKSDIIMYFLKSQGVPFFSIMKVSTPREYSPSTVLVDSFSFLD